MFLYRIGLKNAKTVFFQNKENQQFMIDKKVVKNNYELLPGSGVNLNYFEIMSYPSNEKIVFSFISRIMKEKGIEEYLEAAKIIHEMYPNTEFHICGYCEQDYEKKL